MLKLLLKVICKIVFGVIKWLFFIALALVIAFLIIWLMSESGTNVLQGVYI